jgi:hydroxymethylbilane synthase
MRLRIGSRGSQLALWQAHHIAELLRTQRHEVEIEIIKTTGDLLQAVTFAQVGALTGSKGIFTKEIEEALADGRVDLAVHSLKDLPTELPEPFVLGAIPRRADPRDVLVSVNYMSLAELPAGARVGTSSARRRAQLKAVRTDLEAVEFRGNVDTRLRKLAEGQVEAILLAAAGLDRLDKTEWVRERLDPEQFCPAAGQGALGIEVRKGDEATLEAVGFLDDGDTRFEVTAERAGLAALGGGCQVPIGFYCRVDTQQMLDKFPLERRYKDIYGTVADPQTGAVVRVFHRDRTGTLDAAGLGRLAASMLMDAGAGPLLGLNAGVHAGEGAR